MLGAFDHIARVKAFVQDTLGCGRPDEVFRTIDVLGNRRLADGSIIAGRINIGNRLLIYSPVSFIPRQTRC